MATKRAAAARPAQSRSAAPTRNNRVESPSASKIPNAREGGVRPAPGESRLQDPTVTDWNDLANPSEFGEQPPDGVIPDEDHEERQAAQSAEEKEQKIRALLGRQLGHTDDDGAGAAGATDDGGETTETTEGGETETEEEPAAAASGADEKPPSRRDLMASVDAEQKRLTLERELGNERQARRAAEEALKGGLLAAAKRQGLTKDQAIDLLLSDPNEGTTPAPAANTPDPVNERLTRLEQREREVNKREALEVVETVTKDLDIPVVRATARVSVPGADGRTVVMSGRELVLQTAQRLWENAGKPAGDRKAFIAEAAPLVEAQLIDEQKEAFEAYAKKNGGGSSSASPTPKPKPKPTAPALGRRSPGPGARPAKEMKLPDDPDERRNAIKARFNFR